MSNNVSILNIFVTQLMNFTNDLILLFPNDKDFKLFKNGIVLLKATNPRKILTLFDQYVSKYESKIMVKDETFFLVNTYEELDKTENILNTMVPQLQYIFCCHT